MNPINYNMISQSNFVNLINKFRRYYPYFLLYYLAPTTNQIINKAHIIQFETQRCFRTSFLFLSLFGKNYYNIKLFNKKKYINKNKNYIFKIELSPSPDHVFIIIKYKNKWYVLQSYYHSYSVWDTHGFAEIDTITAEQILLRLDNYINKINLLTGINNTHKRFTPIDKTKLTINITYFNFNNTDLVKFSRNMNNILKEFLKLSRNEQINIIKTYKLLPYWESQRGHVYNKLKPYNIPLPNCKTVNKIFQNTNDKTIKRAPIKRAPIKRAHERTHEYIKRQKQRRSNITSQRRFKNNTEE